MRKIPNIVFAFFLVTQAFALTVPSYAQAEELHFDLASAPHIPETDATSHISEVGPVSNGPQQAGQTRPASRTSAHLADAAPPDARTRTERQVMRMELAYQALNVIDAAQTIYCVSHDKCVEMNPLIGSNPSTGRIIAQKAVTGGLHYLVTRALLARNPGAARIFEFVSLSFQSGIVAWNIRACF